MARINSLVPDAQHPGNAPGFPSGTWYGYVVKPLPVLLSTELWVVIPDIDPTLKWGPCRWLGHALPDEGTEALVLFDNRQNPWVIIWQ